MSDELSRSTDLIERLLGDPELRRSFRADPSATLREHGLAELAEGLPAGERAMLTLELRESRSSLAGVIVAAAAEGVDFTHVAEHAAPRLGREAGRAISGLVRKLTDHHHPKPKPAPRHRPAHHLRPPQLESPVLPQMAKPVHHYVQAPVQQAPQSTEPAAAPASSEPVQAAATPVAHHVAEHALAAPGSGDLLGYPGNDATPQQIAAWMGENARRAGLPPELPVMAALTESGLRNLDYGDRDSVGFFQMRTSIWDEGPYTGYLQNPQKQIEWFINEALSVRRSDPSVAVGGPDTWGNWVADVEQPAAAYRGRYQLHLAEAQELLRGSGLSGGAAPAAPGEGIVDGAAATLRHHHVPLGLAVTHAASHGEGAALQGASLVQYAYAKHGVQLPADAAQQFEVGAAVPRPDLQPGDAVFFGQSHAAIEEVGIYAGDGRVVLGGGAGHEVALDALRGRGMHYLGGRRYSEQLLTGASSYARTLPTVSKHR